VNNPSFLGCYLVHALVGELEIVAFHRSAFRLLAAAGFHYRFSTRVGTDMGHQIGEYVVKSVMQPAATGSR
jgi:hypothetical protein